MFRIHDIGRLIKEREQDARKQAERKQAERERFENTERWHNVQDGYKAEMSRLVRAGYSVPKASKIAGDLWSV